VYKRLIYIQDLLLHGMMIKVARGET